jgi:arabinosaccharide transport system substrate-binding protein
MSNKRFSRREFLKYTGVAAGTLALSPIIGACAPQQLQPAPAAEEGGAQEAAPAAEGVELVFWGFADNRNKWYEALVEPFNGERPDVQIKIESFPYDEMHNKVQTALVAGTGAPDIADIEISRFGQFVKGERVGFVALNDLLGADKDNLFERSALAPWSWAGKNYGIGNELNACLMFYRWDVMEEVGIEVPFETWEDVTEKGKQYAEATGKKFAAVPDADWSYWWMISSAGGGFFDEEGNVAFDSDLGKRTLQMLHDWIYVDEIAMLAPGGDRYNQTYYGAMGAGDFVIEVGAPWYQGFMKDNVAQLEGKWHMQPFPLFADGTGARTATHGGTGTCITEQSKDAEAAWAFIKFCNLNTDSVLKGFEMVNLFPTWKSAWEDPRMQFEDAYFDNQKPAEFISDVGDEMPPLYNSPFWPEVTEAFENLVLNPVMLNEKDVETAMAEGVEEAKRLMES